jgi:hypothetical protein
MYVCSLTSPVLTCAKANTRKEAKGSSAEAEGNFLDVIIGRAHTESRA